MLPKPNKSGNLRGKNPKSHGNRKQGKVYRSHSLFPITVELAKQLGETESNGIDKLFAMLPVFQKAKLALELFMSGHTKAQEYAESIMNDLADLEIEHVYREAIQDGLIEAKKGAWFVDDSEPTSSK